MKSLLIVLFIFVSSFAVNDASAGEVIGAVGATFNDQLSSNGRTYDVTAPLSVRAGYRFSFADLFVEYSYVHSSSGTDMVSIAQTNQEALLWIRKGDPTAHTVKPFIALGAGAHSQTIDTRFSGQTDVQPGGFEPIAAAAVGLEIRLVRHVTLTMEGRATAAEAYTPNPLLGAASYLNFIF